MREKVDELNEWKLPDGVKVKTFYDRTALIHTTVETVTDILISGMVLVFVILFVFLGHFRAAMIVALTIPLSLLFTFTMMVLIGQSANLISLGSIDFGIIVDATLIMVESIFSHLAHDRRIALDGTAADRAGRPPGRSADLLLDGHHRRRLYSTVYDDRRAGENLCADVDHVRVCLARRAVDGLYAGSGAVFAPSERPDSAKRILRLFVCIAPHPSGCVALGIDRTGRSSSASRWSS